MSLSCRENVNVAFFNKFSKLEPLCFFKKLSICIVHTLLSTFWEMCLQCTDYSRMLIRNESKVWSSAYNLIQPAIFSTYVTFV